MGMTPVRTYDPGRKNPILLEAGDYIRFIPVDEGEYKTSKKLYIDNINNRLKMIYKINSFLIRRRTKNKIKFSENKVYLVKKRISVR